MFRPSVNVLSLVLLVVVLCWSVSSATLPMRRCRTHGLLNGHVTPRAGGRFVKYKCIGGFKIFGDKSATCLRGVWEYQEMKPVCVRAGCPKMALPVNGGSTPVRGFFGMVQTFMCDPGFALTGSPVAICNGYSWNTTTPTCVANTSEVSTSCDFESDDLCGWSQAPDHQFDWTRHAGPTPSSSVITGPSWDHTKGKGGNGYYMYLESSSPRLENDTARLVSPVFASDLSQDACFIFYYHMLGQTIGTLNVYVKPEGQPLRPKIFTVTGQQGSNWVRGVARIDPLDEDFQIVVEGVLGSSYHGDVAVDDVRLANETDCEPTATTRDATADTSVPFDADSSQSCRLRCFAAPPSTGDDATVESQSDAKETLAPNACECQAACGVTNTCCEDFDDYCTVPKTSPTPASAASSHRTVASSPYSPPLPTKPTPMATSSPPSTSSVPSTITTPFKTSPISSSPATSTTSRPSEEPKPTSTKSSPSFTVTTIASLSMTPTPKSSAARSRTTKTSATVEVVTKSSTARTASVTPPKTTSPQSSTKPKTTTLSNVTTFPTKTTNIPTKTTSSPSKTTTDTTKTTAPVSKRTPPPVTITKPSSKSTLPSASTASTTPARQTTTDAEQTTIDIEKLIDKETSFLENSKPAKGKGNTWQMAQRAPATHGMSSLALYSGLAAGLCVILAILAAASILVIRRRRNPLRRRNIDDDSEVRFLTADEILDFNIAHPKDDDL